jgi:hypothetical protein
VSFGGFIAKYYLRTQCYYIYGNCCKVFFSEFSFRIECVWGAAYIALNFGTSSRCGFSFVIPTNGLGRRNSPLTQRIAQPGAGTQRR